MAKLSINNLQAFVASYVNQAKISVASFSATHDNTVGLLDKIGKIVNFEQRYEDKLSIFNGEDLEFGKTIEEWAADLILPEDYDATGANALAPHVSTYRPVSYSFTQGRKIIPQTIRFNDVERAVNNAEQFARLIASKYKVFNDSETLFEYNIKRQALATLIARCEAQMDASDATNWSDVAHTTINALFKKDSEATDVYLLVKAYAQGGASSFDDAVAKGYLIKMDLVKEIAKPVDTSTGEAFVKQIKADVEVASDYNEGHSLNGNTLGTAEDNGLVLLVLHGIRNVIDVDVQAGAFHEDKVSLPAQLIAIPNFGGDTSGAYAILMDKRGMRAYNSYRAVRENTNGKGDFLNLYMHTEWSINVSRNTYVKVYKPVSA